MIPILKKKNIFSRKNIKRNWTREKSENIGFNKTDLIKKEKLEELKKVYPNQCVSSKSGLGLDIFKFIMNFKLNLLAILVLIKKLLIFEAYFSTFYDFYFITIFYFEIK